MFYKRLFIFLALFFSITSAPFAKNKTENAVQKLPNYVLKYASETTASKADIWALWADVENWKKFDVRLEYSYLENDAPFESGSIGYLKAKNAPKTKFELIDVIPNTSFTEVLSIPLYQKMDLKRYFETSETGALKIVHEVHFKGQLRGLMYAILCAPFKKDLKLVVEHIKMIAESKDS